MKGNAESLIAEYCVVYFGNDWNAENRTSSHHIASRLKGKVNMLYVDSPGLRAPQVSGRDFRKIFRKLFQTIAKPESIGELGWRCTIPQLPFRKFPGVSAFNQMFARLAVKRALRLCGLSSQPVILWFVVPHPGFLVGQLGEKFVVYYCIDDYAAHPGMDVKVVANMDRQLTENANRVFVAPPSLVEGKRAKNARTTFSPHGVDVELFGQVNDPNLTMPDELRELPRPVIGFFGLVADWIDTELIEAVARSIPHGTILLVGHESTDTSRLKKLTNVKFVGPKPYQELPRWAKSFDVAMIPYRLTQQVKNANPLKLREYLATGIPIVAVSNPEIEKFADHVYIATDASDFVKGIHVVMEGDSSIKRRLRISSVSNMSWDQRVNETLNVVNSDLKELTSSPSHRL